MKARRILKFHKIRGFTLVEIMVVVAIIALLVSIAIPGFMRARKRSQATRVLDDLRLIDDAIDLYALANSKSPGVNPTWADLKVYLKQGTLLYDTGADVLGQPYGPFTVDRFPNVPSATKSALSDVADSTFWWPYE